MQIQRQGEWLSASIGTECVMMNVASGNYLTLSRVGTRIWELIAQPISESELCTRLTSEFDVSSEICSLEVSAFLADLAKHGAVSPSA